MYCSDFMFLAIMSFSFPLNLGIEVYGDGDLSIVIFSLIGYARIVRYSKEMCRFGGSYE